MKRKLRRGPVSNAWSDLSRPRGAGRRCPATKEAEGTARCAFCGRPEEEGSLRVLGRTICPVCERITVALKPTHPLFPFWVHVVKGLFQDP